MTSPSAGGAVPSPPPVFRSAEVRVPATEDAWTAAVSECANGVMRLRLQPAPFGAMPLWPEGTSVDCTVGSGRRNYSSAARVLRQSGPDLWLRVPSEWPYVDRRASPRRQAAFLVNYRTEDREGTATCVDVSEGGMCLAMEEPLQLRKCAELTFTLPGESSLTLAQGMVVYIAEAAYRRRPRMGVSFTLISGYSRERIAAYCRGRADA